MHYGKTANVLLWFSSCLEESKRQQ